MSVQPKPRMTVDEFLAWAEGRPGRYELLDGEVVAMSPERFRHSDAKFAIQLALHAAIRREGVPCRVVPDGMTVRIDRSTAFEPDAAVYCGPRAAPDAVDIPNPILVVEVLSPSTKSIDSGQKLTDYFRLPSVMHYLIVDPVKRIVVHHRRGTQVIETRIASEGELVFDPPGFAVLLADLFDDA